MFKNVGREPSPVLDPKPKIRFYFFVLCVLSGIGFLIYSNTFQSSFHYDGAAVILDNEDIQDVRNVRGGSPTAVSAGSLLFQVSRSIISWEDMMFLGITLSIS